MSSPRRPLPTDLVALVSFDGRVHPNEAKPLDRLGLDERAHALESTIEQWFSFATGKHTWVSVRGATIRGLISARPRAKRSAWEVDALIDVDEDEEVALSLFSRMISGITKQRGERIFLRLDVGSHVSEAARKAGFFPYSHCVPANVRAIEGPTFREWLAAQESWGGSTKDLLVEEDGIISVWLRLMTGHTGRFSLIAQSTRFSTEEVLQGAFSHLNASRQVLCLVPEYNGAWTASLERLGFDRLASYTCYAQRLVKPVEELAKETAGQAIPVS